MRERVGAMLGKERRGGGEGARRLARSTPSASASCSASASALGGTLHDLRPGRPDVGVVKQLLRAAGADRAYDAQAVLARISNAKNAFRAPTTCRSARATSTTRSRRSSTRATSRRCARSTRSTSTISSARSRASGATHEDVLARWQTSVPLRPRRRVPGHEPRAARAAAPPRAASTAQRLRRRRRRPVDLRAGAAPTCATSSTSRSTSPARSVVKLEQNYRSRAADPRRRQRRHREAHRLASSAKVLFTDARRRRQRAARASRRRPRSRRRSSRREVQPPRARGGHARRSDIAVLYRSNGQSRLIEEALREQGVAAPRWSAGSSSSSARRSRTSSRT